MDRTKWYRVNFDAYTAFMALWEAHGKLRYGSRKNSPQYQDFLYQWYSSDDWLQAILLLIRTNRPSRVATESIGVGLQSVVVGLQSEGGLDPTAVQEIRRRIETELSPPETDPAATDEPVTPTPSPESSEAEGSSAGVPNTQRHTGGPETQKRRIDRASNEHGSLSCRQVTTVIIKGRRQY
jgi:hypothetical protein